MSIEASIKHLFVSMKINLFFHCRLKNAISFIMIRGKFQFLVSDKFLFSYFKFLALVIVRKFSSELKFHKHLQW